MNFSSYSAAQICTILGARVWSGTLRAGTHVEALNIDDDDFSEAVVVGLYPLPGKQGTLPEMADVRWTAAPPSAASLKKLGKADLQTRLLMRGLDDSGAKPVLIARLSSAPPVESRVPLEFVRRPSIRPSEGKSVGGGVGGAGQKGGAGGAGTGSGRKKSTIGKTRKAPGSNGGRTNTEGGETRGGGENACGGSEASEASEELEDMDTFSAILAPMAVELCARKIAARSGDLRTALDICRRAVMVRWWGLFGGLGVTVCVCMCVW
jgi:hypothetical protein